MNRITTLHTNGRTFAIVRYQGKYCSIEEKFITDGKLNTPLYGPALHTGRTVAECVEFTCNACKVDELEAEGIDRMVACVMVVGNVSRDRAEEMLARAKEIE